MLCDNWHLLSGTDSDLFSLTHLILGRTLEGRNNYHSLSQYQWLDMPLGYAPQRGKSYQLNQNIPSTARLDLRVFTVKFVLYCLDSFNNGY